MKITEIRLGIMSVPLITPFKTALRTVSSVEDVILELHTDTGAVGYGEAAPTAVITGDTQGSIIEALRDYIGKKLIGRDVEDFESLQKTIQTAMVHNSSAKACADIALYDQYAQMNGLPIYKMLGASRKSIETDITISVNAPEEMAADAQKAIARGYDCLKIKVGSNPALDVARLTAVRAVIPTTTKLRIDANQGWKPKEGVRILNDMQARGLDIEFVEQPVAAQDIDGLKYVTDHSDVPVLADESVFSPMDALKILQLHAADMVNIKLMKCGGLSNGLKIAALAEVYGAECMIGCMLEGKISVSAAVHLACARSVITKIDLDGPVLCSEDPVVGGAIFNEKKISLTDDAGLGIRKVGNIRYLD